MDLLDVLAQVEDNANPDFIDEAMTVIEHLARVRVEFTTDDVWPRLSHGESYMQRGYWDELWSRRLNGPKGSRSDADAVASRGFLEVVLDGYNA